MEGTCSKCSQSIASIVLMEIMRNTDIKQSDLIAIEVLQKERGLLG